MNILNKLTIKHLLMNKKRTIVTIIGIILSTALMVGIGTIASSFRNNALNQVIESNGDYHVKMSEIPYENYKYIENNVDIKKATLEHSLGYAILNGSENEYKPYLYLEEVDQSYFENVKLKSGRLPKNNQEIVVSEHVSTNGKVNYQLGDKVTLDIGNRATKDEEGKDYFLDQNSSYAPEEETFIPTTQKTYTIVGFMERLTDEPYQAPGYTVLTKIDKNAIAKKSNVKSIITYKQIKDVHKKTEQIAKTVKLPHDTYDGKICYDMYLDYNEGLLSFYGESSYGSINNTLFGVIAVVLGLIMIGCAIVIYNSFAISVMERKKQFGLFSSIGATKKQLRKTVFYEAFLVSLIGIPIGVLSGLFGIFVVLQITNYLLPNVFSTPLTMSLYPTFIILPIIYMIITIIISAYLPARKASKISPIEAIRLNDDIKVKRKTVKTNRITEKLFGIEGELARKNMKRNKKKYRITILSLVVSIVLFIAFSTFVEYANKSTNSILEVRNYDILIRQHVDDDVTKQMMDQLLKVDGITNKVVYQDYYTMLEFPNEATKEFKNQFKGYMQLRDASIVVLSDEEFKTYIQALHLNEKEYQTSEMKPILINRYSSFDYEKMKIKQMKIFEKEEKVSLQIVKWNGNEAVDGYKNQAKISIEAALADRYPNDFIEQDFRTQMTFIISESMKPNIAQEESQGYFMEQGTIANVVAKDHAKVAKEMNKIIEKQFGEDNSSITVIDITAGMQLQKNLVIVVGMFLYGFIALVTLIGVTSVFNTINTSIALRRKEFAVLRSIGLTPHGFNKMIRYESILYGLKSLMYGLPISLGVVLLFHLAFMNTVEFDSILIPWKAIIIAIISVFIITFLTMMYATSKIKKENILDAIREENI